MSAEVEAGVGRGAEEGDEGEEVEGVPLQAPPHQRLHAAQGVATLALLAQLCR